MKFYLKEDIKQGMLIPLAWIWHGKLGYKDSYGIQIRFPWYVRKQLWSAQDGYESTHQLVLRIHKFEGPETYEFIFIPVSED